MELIFVDAQNYRTYRQALIQFGESIYLESFPNPDEREPFEHILQRIEAGQASYPETYAVLAFDEKELVGGSIYDLYSNSQNVELIYIAIDSKQRKKGFGGRLSQEGTELLYHSLPQRPRTLYFETENPITTVRYPGIDPIKRLRFFATHNAKRVPIQYIQPPLSDATECATNLMLCTLPEFCEEPDEIDMQDLSEFITDFYQGLNAYGSEAYNQVLQSIQTEATSDGKIVFESLQEEPQFKIESFAITWHFHATDIPIALTEGDPIFNSYECDLMDYQHQAFEARPIKSRHIRLMEDMFIQLPPCYTYSSEGHTFVRLSHHQDIPVSLSINISEGLDKNHIAHVVIAPEQGTEHEINELDIIKLVTLFGSLQEEYKPIHPIRFACKKDNRTWDSIEELLQEVIAPGTYEPMRCGLSEIELPLTTELCDLLSDTPSESEVNKTICGLILGIFDFKRMNQAEIVDTIKPIVIRQNSFINICRGHIMKVKCAEQSERTENILISPYLLIPSAALCLNELTLKEAQKVISAPLDKKQSLYKQGETLSESIRKVNEALNNNYYRDFFNYQSEQEIMACASKSRGYQAQYASILIKVKNTRSLMENCFSKYQAGVGVIESALLAILAVLQVAAAIDNSSIPAGIMIGLIIIGAIFIILRRRRM